MIGWWRRHRHAKRLVRADAKGLIEQLGEEGAWYEARHRTRLARAGTVVDHDRPPRHWTRVSIEISRRSVRKVGLDTATRYLER